MRSTKVMKNMVMGLEKACLRLNMPEFFEHNTPGDKVRILMYHSIAAGGSLESLFSGDEFRTTPVNLEKQVAYLLKHGYSFLTLGEYLAALSGAKDLPEKTAILTFDDGFRSHYTEAFGILKKYRIKATFFPILECPVQDKISWIHKFHRYVNKYGDDGFSGMVKYHMEPQDIAGCKNDSDIIYFFMTKLEPVKKQRIISRINEEFGFDGNAERLLAAQLYMNWDQISAISAGDMEIGLHTVSHMPVNSRYFDAGEIADGKKTLEARLQRRVVSFSYPFGLYSDDGILALKRSGFMGAVVAQHGNNSRHDDPFLLKRINAGYFDMDEMRKQLSGFSVSNCLKGVFQGAKR